jgi:guanosine-3',5'-bis(diphosphate) 3'-pyrophosphohydrolase
MSHSNDLATLLRALAFSAEKHRDQRRKDADASPYINHPIALANVLANEGGITDLVPLAGAILHDTVEDTNTTPDELIAQFGEEIASVVMEVTDDKSLAKAERKAAQIEHAPGLSRAAKLVKLADKISNLRDILASPPADWPNQRKLQYFEWASRVVDGLRGVHPALEAEFDRVASRGRTRFADAGL